MRPRLCGAVQCRRESGMTARKKLRPYECQQLLLSQAHSEL